MPPVPCEGCEGCNLYGVGPPENVLAGRLAWQNYSPGLLCPQPCSWGPNLDWGPYWGIMASASALKTRMNSFTSAPSVAAQWTQLR